MTLTATEQFAIELMNRARLDPAAEAARYGLTLNEGLAAGTITATAKQVLAPHSILELSAQRHSQWMIDTDTFSHTGVNGTDPRARMELAGYNFTGAWSWGENLAFASLGGGRTVANITAIHHETLMNSPGHRANILRDSFREIGYAEVAGAFNGSNVSVATQNFAHRGAVVYVTGVAYNDLNNNNFYTPGEGLADLRFAVTGGNAARTAAAGGYAVVASQVSALAVEVGSGATLSRVTLNLAAGNVKLDLVDGDRLLTSGHMTLVSGIADAGLLGIANLTLTGNAAANELSGNAGANRLTGGGGNDTINGGGGHDTIQGGAGADIGRGANGNDSLLGGDGADFLRGGNGNDVLSGHAGNDRLYGDTGNDRLDGWGGNDRLTGGNGADVFVFRNNYGTDRVLDFNPAEGDRLRIDDALWGGTSLTAAQVVGRYAEVTAAGVVFDFPDTDMLILANLDSLAGLAGTITII
ncbi:MAG TPA: CAP domain-containing protein [Paracoccaceae bacterium]